MKVCIVTIAFAWGLAAFSQAQGDALKDQKALQGTWKVTKGVSAGKAMPDDLIKKITIVIEGDKITQKLDADVISETSFKIDGGKKPKHMDGTRLSGPTKGTVSLTIYELDGDNLKICGFMGDENTKKRPASFDDDKTAPTNTMYLQRQKK